MPDCFTYFDPSSVESLQAAIHDLDEYITSQATPFLGIIGFSQGASLVASYLFWKRLCQSTSLEPVIRCIIMICPAVSADCRGNGRILNAEDDGIFIDVPTAVIYGSKDQDAKISLEFTKMCHPELCEILDHGGGHEVPRGGQITAQMARSIAATLSKVAYIQ